MTKNYDATLLKPYVKTYNVNLDYSSYDDREMALSIAETTGIKDSQGKYLDIIGQYTGSIYQLITKDEMAITFPLINVDTGEDTGETMTITEMSQAVISFARKLQKERDNPVVNN
jgi:hypothetical protein